MGERRKRINPEIARVTTRRVAHARQYLNPPGRFHHPNYTRVLTVEKPSKLIYTATVGIAYVCGFAVLLAPSGLGVREFVFMLFLVALLGITSPQGEASLLLAVLALRLAWTAAEVVMIALVWTLPGPPVLLRKGAEP